MLKTRVICSCAKCGNPRKHLGERHRNEQRATRHAPRMTGARGDGLNRVADYDSTKDTRTHIAHVKSFLDSMLAELWARGNWHDESKLDEPEKSAFDEYTPLLEQTTYGSERYKFLLEQLGPALKHHYEENSHHPEHYENGIDDMSLLDILEMLCDWKAATLRHADGDIMKSIEMNEKRFGLSPQLRRIFENTVREMGWE